MKYRLKLFPNALNLSMQTLRKYATKLQPKSEAMQHTDNPAEYCFELVRKFDKENFLASILLESSARSCAIAVRAFNIEIARIQDQVTDPKIGLMRFQFWEDALIQLFKKYNKNENHEKVHVPNHPILHELRKITDRHKLSKRYFLRLLTCRREQLACTRFRTLEELEAYCENSVSSVYYLLLEGANVQNIHADHVASHLGRAQGLTNTLRSFSYGSDHRLVFMPTDLLVKYKISEETILRKKCTKEVKDAVFEMATHANQHLKMARSLKKDLPEHVIPLFLPGIAVDLYLTQLRKHDFDVFSTNLRKSSPILPIMFWWKHRRLQY